jgi:hypothetical protein
MRRRLLEQLAIGRRLLRVENSFDLRVGPIPNGAHLGRRATRTTAACAIWRRTNSTTTTSATPSPAAASTPAPTASAPAAPSATLAARVFSERLQVHRFVREDRTDFGLLRGIELQRFRQPRHPVVDHLARIHSLASGRTLLLRILPLRAGAACERHTPDN